MLAGSAGRKCAMKNTLILKLKLDYRIIDTAEKRSSYFLRSHGFSDHTVQIQIDIITELIKNAIKYADFTSAAEIYVRLQINKNTYTIEVINPIDETCSGRLMELDKTIQFIRGYQDPYEAYLMKMAEIAADPSKAEANDLGLAKIAYEGGAILDFFISEDNFLNVSAVGSFDDHRILES